MDGDNGSIIRKGKKQDKLESTARDGNIALEVDRPVLPMIGFNELKEDLIQMVDKSAEYKKP